MFSWFSKSQSNKLKVSTLTKAEIKSSNSSYIPGMQWLVSKSNFLKDAIVNLLPSIKITGRGLTLNGFYLNHIPESLRKTFMFGMALSFVATAKANELIENFLYTDASNRTTHYQLDLKPDSIQAHNKDYIMNDMELLCKGMLSNVSFPLSFDRIESWYSRPGIELQAVFLRAVNEAIQPLFESCVIEAVNKNHPHINYKFLGEIFGFVAVFLTLVCVYCYLREYLPQKCSNLRENCRDRFFTNPPTVQQPLISPNTDEKKSPQVVVASTQSLSLSPTSAPSSNSTQYFEIASVDNSGISPDLLLTKH